MHDFAAPGKTAGRACVPMWLLGVCGVHRGFGNCPATFVVVCAGTRHATVTCVLCYELLRCCIPNLTDFKFALVLHCSVKMMQQPAQTCSQLGPCC